MKIVVVLLVAQALLTLVLGVNPVSTPIITNGLKVFVRRYAKLPPELDGEPARINAMVSHSSSLYVVTLSRIYRIYPGRKIGVFFDAADAIKKATGRKLQFEEGRKKHGGIRSLAFHPDFKRNRLIYITAMERRPRNTSRFKYISDVPDPIDADSVLLEFQVGKTSQTPKPLSYRCVFRVGMPVFDHPIKQIAFHGKFLYIAHGDASVQSAVAGGGMKSDALGKILRINPLKKGTKPYTVPETNPFRNSRFMIPEVWALGFRNPHHICFSKNGALISADAGRSNIEEVNIVVKKGNYGWPAREGTFVHAGGGLISGIRSLPRDDAKHNFIYPAAQVGHDGPFRAGFIGQAIAGGYPVENGSPMAGNYYYSDFPESGKLFYSKLSELFRARTQGAPGSLTQAHTKQAVIMYDHDDDPSTPWKQLDALGDILRMEKGFQDEPRVDVRFGQGENGELYWSSKKNGRVYIMTNSLPPQQRGKK